MPKRDRHPTSEVLLKALDGELSPRELKAVNRHLQACWKCRAESSGIESAVHAYATLAARLASPGRLSPPNNWAGFHAKLKSLEPPARKRKIEALKQLLRSLFLGRVALPFQAALAILTAVLFWTRFDNIQVVSASELLRRATQAENVVPVAGRAPEIFQRIAFRLNRTAFVRSVYRDALQRRQPTPRFAPASDSISAAVLNADISECRETMDKAQLSFDEPLSPSRFEAWLGLQEHDHREFVTQFQNRLRLTSEFDGGPIRSAELVVRETDYHAIQERFRFADHRELEITELTYDLRPPLPLEAHAAHPVNRIARLLPGIPPRPNVRAEEEDRRQEAEMLARAILHRAGADLGEQVSAGVTDGEVVITGIVETASRKSDLLDAFKDTTGIRVDLRTIDEAAAALPMGGPPPAPVDNDSRIAPPMLAEAMKAAFESVERRQEYVKRLLSLSDRTRSHAFALRQLAQRYTPELVPTLPLECQRQLRELVADHLHAIQEEREQLTQQLQPFVGADLDPTPRIASLAWQSRAFRIVETVQQEHNDLIALFAGTSAAGRPVSEVERELESALEEDAANLSAARKN